MQRGPGQQVLRPRGADPKLAPPPAPARYMNVFMYFLLVKKRAPPSGKTAGVRVRAREEISGGGGVRRMEVVPGALIQKNTKP